MKTKTILSACGAALGLLAIGSPALAVTNGVPDGDGHPHVGLLIFDVDGVPAWRCSGTLISPTVMVTAGHCTDGATAGRVWFESDVGAGRPGNGYPVGGGTSIELTAIHTHPQYLPNAFYAYDVGVVILSEPVILDTYGVLPPLGALDGLATRRGLQSQLFNPVGYGIQSIKPNLQRDLVRYTGEVMLVDISGTNGIPRGTSVVFSNNPGQKATGGTCFGDSGGPVFWDGSNVMAAVVSYGLNQNCKGTSGGYRLDQLDDQNFINSFLP
jgi:hypothetical protein